MAQHKSAEKRHRQNLKRTERNGAIRSRMRKAIRTARAAADNGDENKGSLFDIAIREVNRAASRNILKKRTASRYVSRLTRAAAR